MNPQCKEKRCLEKASGEIIKLLGSQQDSLQLEELWDKRRPDLTEKKEARLNQDQ